MQLTERRMCAEPRCERARYGTHIGGCVPGSRYGCGQGLRSALAEVSRSGRMNPETPPGAGAPPLQPRNAGACGEAAEEEEPAVRSAEQGW